MQAADRRTASARRRTKDAVQHTAAHLTAMHLSGALLLLTFLMPLTWIPDAPDAPNTPYASSPGGPTTEAPGLALALLMVVFACMGFHVLVQIPSGLLGTWIARDHTARVGYALALVSAGVLTAALLCGVTGDEQDAEILPLWTEFMARVSLPLASYVWLSRRLGTRPA